MNVHLDCCIPKKKIMMESRKKYIYMALEVERKRRKKSVVRKRDRERKKKLVRMCTVIGWLKR